MVQECEEGLVSSAAEVNFGLDYGRQLLDDHVLTDQDKPTVRLEIDQLKFELDELKRRISYEKDRYTFFYFRMLLFSLPTTKAQGCLQEVLW